MSRNPPPSITEAISDACNAITTEVFHGTMLIAAAVIYARGYDARDPMDIALDRAITIASRLRALVEGQR